MKKIKKIISLVVLSVLALTSPNMVNADHPRPAKIKIVNTLGVHKTNSDTPAAKTRANVKRREKQTYVTRDGVKRIKLAKHPMRKYWKKIAEDYPIDQNDHIKETLNNFVNHLNKNDWKLQPMARAFMLLLDDLNRYADAQNPKTELGSICTEIREFLQGLNTLVDQGNISADSDIELVFEKKSYWQKNKRELIIGGAIILTIVISIVVIKVVVPTLMAASTAVGVKNGGEENPDPEYGANLPSEEEFRKTQKQIQVIIHPASAPAPAPVPQPEPAPMQESTPEPEELPDPAPTRPAQDYNDGDVAIEETLHECQDRVGGWGIRECMIPIPFRRAAGWLGYSELR